MQSIQLMSPAQLRATAAQSRPQVRLMSPQLLQKFSQVSNLMQNDAYKAPATQRPVMNPVNLFPPSIYQPQARPQLPALSAPVARPGASAPAMNMKDFQFQSSINQLKTMSPTTLKNLGKSNKEAFFKALLPAAIESEKEFGVPAEVTLAQAALESAWARSPIGGYNIFGIKGRGPAGTVNVGTKEYLNGRYVSIKDNFAKYNNFYEAVKEHGELFHNGYYDKAVDGFSKNKNTYAFIDNIQGIYATDPHYSKKIKSIIEDYGLTDMVNNTGVV